VWGIPLRLHSSWFMIFFLITWTLATGYFPVEYPALGGAVYWILGAVTSLLFAASVLLHELGHSWVALREGVPVRGVTLFLFGGVAQIDKEPSTAGGEFRIAIMGPVVSFALALLFSLLWALDQSVPFLAAPSAYLARINFSLALFNLIPGFPLDGGRVLRSIVWKLTGSLPKATHFATGAGQLVAFGFIAFGIYNVLQGGLFNGLWLIFIGWFLQNAAAATAFQSSMQQSLRGVRVEQVMSREFTFLPINWSLQMVVDRRVLNGGERTFLVTDAFGGKLEGMLTLREISAVPQERWPLTVVRDVMVPCERLIVARPQADLLAALQRMDEANVAQVPVLDDLGVAQGVLSREQVLRYVRLRSEIGM
ncbi:MAG TPA: site-2 protease family protein, partial [Anaerolineaceae bacterium]|nr:site-2 protease family protein [Anaerolineaceae bacterium]